jgi:uncharacterized protein
MPRRFFRKFALKREHLRGQWWLAPFNHLLHDPNLWVIRRRNVVPAFALGLFVAYLPFPGHMLIAALLALALRVNLTVAAITTLVSNPFTMGPMYYAAFELGRRLLRQAPRTFEFEMSFDWLFDRFVYIWQPLTLGSVLLGAILSLVGFIALDLLWRASISDYLARRRKKRAGKKEQ